MQKTPIVLQKNRNFDYIIHHSLMSIFDAEVDVTGSEVTTVDERSFVVEKGEVSILDNKDKQDSDSQGNTSSDSDVKLKYERIADLPAENRGKIRPCIAWAVSREREKNRKEFRRHVNVEDAKIQSEKETCWWKKDTQ
ncbi:unnamed protein product [Porites lobata]|uniref:Cyclic nucleotide-binding domain-containing protein n=1 Tax=Porites lobata TaxID=104759 RepID=A0ABN8N9Z8_9CNID|nr:unnamed protein product [Porites lobata]